MFIKIRAEGPGGTMGAPLWKIKKVLKELGFEVEDQDTEKFTDEQAEMVLNRVDKFSGKVVITTDNQPWGG